LRPGRILKAKTARSQLTGGMLWVMSIALHEVDPHVNPIGAKGIGEIGITGSSAAVANAIFHATGRRVRDLPITVDKLI
jgi:xanthine dehydrogenase YagR molybdenum-binding subunit